MSEIDPNPLSEQRRLVQRILTGSIPAGKELDECREALASSSSESTALPALFTLLQCAVADPFFGIEDSREVVRVLKALARGDMTAGDLL